MPGLLLTLFLAGPMPDLDAMSPEDRAFMVFSYYVHQAAGNAGIPAPGVTVEPAIEEFVNAWILRPWEPHEKPKLEVYLAEEYAAVASPRRLCLTAYHEVCHLRLALTGQYDDPEHQANNRCMTQIGGESCLKE